MKRNADDYNRFKQKFSALIRDKRGLTKLSQIELAKNCGISQSTYSKIETGKLVPDAYSLIRMCNELNILKSDLDSML